MKELDGLLVIAGGLVVGSLLSVLVRERTRLLPVRSSRTLALLRDPALVELRPGQGGRC